MIVLRDLPWVPLFQRPVPGSSERALCGQRVVYYIYKSMADTGRICLCD